MSDRPTAPGTPSVSPKATRRIIGVLIGICVLVSVADFFYDKDAHFAFQKIPAFNSLYGFVSFVFLVFTAIVLRRIVMRDENYYD